MRDKFKAANNRVACIYGPPEMLEERKGHGKKNKGKDETMNKKKVTGIAAIISLLVASLTGCKDDFDPSNNKNEEIYGPPEMFEQYYDNSSADDYNVEDNVNDCIYGPPEMFENEEENLENTEE